MSKRKPTGLSTFTTAPAVAEAPPPKKGSGKLIAFTVRLPPEQWERVHHLATSERSSLQALAVDGISLIFKQKGLPPL